jgi:hypothetical protein
MEEETRRQPWVSEAFQSAMTLDARKVLADIFIHEDPGSRIPFLDGDQVARLKPLFLEIQANQMLASSVYRGLMGFHYQESSLFTSEAAAGVPRSGQDDFSPMMAQDLLNGFAGFVALWLRVLHSEPQFSNKFEEANLGAYALLKLQQFRADDSHRIQLSLLPQAFLRTTKAALNILFAHCDSGCQAFLDVTRALGKEFARIILQLLPAMGGSSAGVLLATIMDNLLRPTLKTIFGKEFLTKVWRTMASSVLQLNAFALMLEEVSRCTGFGAPCRNEKDVVPVMVTLKCARRLTQHSLRALSRFGGTSLFPLRLIIVQDTGVPVGMAAVNGRNATVPAGEVADSLCLLWTCGNRTPLRSHEFWADYVAFTISPTSLEQAFSARRSALMGLRMERETLRQQAAAASQRVTRLQAALEQAERHAQRAMRDLQQRREAEQLELAAHADAAPAVQSLPEDCGFNDSDLELLPELLRASGAEFVCSLTQNFIQRCPVQLRLKSGGLSAQVYDRDMVSTWVMNSIRQSTERDVQDPNSRAALDIHHPGGVFVQTRLLWMFYQSLIETMKAAKAEAAAEAVRPPLTRRVTRKTTKKSASAAPAPTPAPAAAAAARSPKRRSDSDAVEESDKRQRVSTPSESPRQHGSSDGSFDGDEMEVTGFFY